VVDPHCILHVHSADFIFALNPPGDNVIEYSVLPFVE